jgi:hypothetical protein
MRIIYIMGNCFWDEVKYFHMIGTTESERLKVSALNLLHLTASPPCQKVGFFHGTMQPGYGVNYRIFPRHPKSILSAFL